MRSFVTGSVRCSRNLRSAAGPACAPSFARGVGGKAFELAPHRPQACARTTGRARVCGRVCGQAGTDRQDVDGAVGLVHVVQGAPHRHALGVLADARVHIRAVLVPRETHARLAAPACRPRSMGQIDETCYS